MFLLYEPKKAARLGFLLFLLRKDTRLGGIVAGEKTPELSRKLLFLAVSQGKERRGKNPFSAKERRVCVIKESFSCILSCFDCPFAFLHFRSENCCAFSYDNKKKT